MNDTILVAENPEGSTPPPKKKNSKKTKSHHQKVE